MAINIVNLYRRKNPNIVALWRKMDHIIFCMATGITGTLGPLTYGPGYIRLPNGLFLHYPELRGSYNDRGHFTDVSYLGGRTRTKIYGGLLTENVVQALARVIVGEQMLVVQDTLKIPVVTMSHDEIVGMVPLKQAPKALENMIKVMSTPPAWAPDIPLAAEGGWDVIYSK